MAAEQVRGFHKEAIGKFATKSLELGQAIRFKKISNKAATVETLEAPVQWQLAGDITVCVHIVHHIQIYVQHVHRQNALHIFDNIVAAPDVVAAPDIVASLTILLQAVMYVAIYACSATQALLKENITLVEDSKGAIAAAKGLANAI